MSDGSSLLGEIFAGLDRLAPGSDESTQRALDLVRRVREPLRILDAGCGTGASTVVLLRHTTASVVAVDIDPRSLATLRDRAAAAGVADRVETRVASIGELDFVLGSFDVIWSEGAIYTIGFDAGLRSWRRLLGEGGIVACSELTWLTDEPSSRARAFWGEGYPAMRSIDANVSAAVTAGYRCLGHFVLPASDWTEQYYGPLQRRIDALRATRPVDAAAAEMLDGIQAEIDLYRDAGGDYGYVFYLFEKSA